MTVNLSLTAFHPHQTAMVPVILQICCPSEALDKVQDFPFTFHITFMLIACTCDKVCVEESQETAILELSLQ